MDLICCCSSSILHVSSPSFRSSVLPSPSQTRMPNGRSARRVMASSDAAKGNPNTFLTLEEVGLIELSNLDMHERFLCRLTVSSLNLLRVISEQEGIAIEDLNAGKICDWFQKDKAKREQDIESATLKWDNKPGW